MRTNKTRAEGGFSLIELIVVVTIMAVLAGATVPVATKLFTYKAREATKAELQTLSDASAAYFEDTNDFPSEVADLLVDPGGVSGWSGPYLPGVVTDTLSGLTGYQVDAWSRAYTMADSGDVLTITSMGSDGALGTSADVDIDLDVTHIRREKTLRWLSTINTAIAHYNAQYLSTAPLPANYASVYATLVSSGFLPAASEYQLDAWGVSYEETPAGSSPVVEVASTSVGS